MITFGICVSNRQSALQCIGSIMSMEYYSPDIMEILVIQDHSMQDQPLSIVGVKDLFLDSDVKQAWITRKKNILVQNARYENICLVHDYYMFDQMWIKSFVNFMMNKPKESIWSNQILTAENTRHSDWLVDQHYMDLMLLANPALKERMAREFHFENGPRWVCGLPYDVSDLSHIQYISGGYILGRTQALKDVPLNEDLTWGMAEDLEWSRRVIAHGHRFKFNPDKNAKVYLRKKHKWRLYQMPDEAVSALREMFGNVQ